MRPILFAAIILILTSTPGEAWGQPASNSEIAPQGKSRIALNAATAVLLKRTPDGNTTGGVGLEVGKFIAKKLGTVLELVAYPNSNTYAQSFGKGEWDIGFGVKSPLVSEKADFILDLLLNDYLFVAAPGREFADAGQVDRTGVRVGVARGGAAEQTLSRALKSAELVPGSGGVAVSDAIEILRTGKAAKAIELAGFKGVRVAPN